jgi:hypothetical protein
MRLNVIIASFFIFFSASIKNVKGRNCASCGGSNWPIAVAQGKSTNYQVPSTPDAYYVWTATDGLEIISGSSTNSVTIMPNSTGKLCVGWYKQGLGVCSDCATINVKPLPATPPTINYTA